jgi:hypothetical protein
MEGEDDGEFNGEGNACDVVLGRFSIMNGLVNDASKRRMNSGNHMRISQDGRTFLACDDGGDAL